jgi:hypothetical protein
MISFAPVTDDDLARARQDPAFRQKLLSQNLEVLLAVLKKERQAARATGTAAAQLREGVQLAVRLAELIQAAVPAPRHF